MFDVRNEIERFDVGWALLPVTYLDGQECPSYKHKASNRTQ